jgi:large subunit ribosomal protein L36e
MARPKKAPKKAKSLTKGHAVTKLPKVKRPSDMKGRLGKRAGLVRAVIRQVSGFAPYEKRIMELLQVGGAKEDKRALKIAKKSLGTHRRGMLKREALREIVQAARRKN